MIEKAPNFQSESNHVRLHEFSLPYENVWLCGYLCKPDFAVATVKTFTFLQFQHFTLDCFSTGARIL